MTVRKVWTEAEIRALGVRMDGVTACEVVYGCGRTLAYDLLRRGAVDFRVLRAGTRYVVPTADILRLLLDDAPAAPIPEPPAAPGMRRRPG